MIYKSIRYYQKTSWLKLAAFIVDAVNRAGLIDNYKTGNHRKYSTLFHRDFTENWTDAIRFENFYLPYAFFKSPVELAKHLKFDKNKVPIGRLDVKLKHHNPLFSCYYGLVCFNSYNHTTQQENLDEFLNQVDFLNRYGIENSNGFWLPYLEDLPKFELKAPWFAGITQALAISVFIRAYVQTDQEIYRQRAIQLYRPLFIPVEEGGFLKNTLEGYLWIEEYPSRQPTYVLNGFVFIMIALVEYFHEVEHTILVKERLDKCMETFFNSLHHYTFGAYTKYSRKGRTFSNIEYQGLYVFLFLHLYHLTGKSAFKELARFYNSNTDWALFFSFFQIKEGHERVEFYLRQL